VPDADNPDPLLDLLGEPVEAADLTLDRAQRLARFLLSRDDVGARLVEARQRDGWEWLILEVDVDVGQAPVADIRHQEPIAIRFTPEDRDWPRTLALRPDFPDDLSHEFLRADDTEPVALCLSEEPWQEARLRWSPGDFIRLIRRWLIETGCGTLHDADQALEPFIAAGSIRVILPVDLFAPERAGAPLFGVHLGQEGVGAPLYSFAFEPQQKNALPAVAAVLLSAPKVHGAIRHGPKTLAEVLALFGADAPDFATTLDAYVRAWLQNKNAHGAMPLLVIQVPMLRHEGEEPERYDLWPLFLDASVVEVGVALDLWSLDGDGGEIFFDRKPGPYGEAIRVAAANPLYELGPRQAADFNGYGSPSGKSLLVVGAGALGSQVIANLTRMGETVSTIADEDRLLPHNLARHAVWNRDLVGWAKAPAMALMVSHLSGSASGPEALVFDVTDPQAAEAEPFLETLRASDVILDLAASVAVSRRLALDEEGGGRRIAAFLSPNGQDLVVLAEDGQRESRLDHLEMALYASALTDPDLAGHFALPPERRYARGCREVSVRIPQTAVALHAAVAADRIRHLIDGEAAFAGVWRLDAETMTVRHVPLDARPMHTFPLGDWTVLLTQPLLETLSAQRLERLPTETGGILLGVFDADRKMIYVVAHVPSPPDSIETPDAYVRGAFGAEGAVQTAGEATLSMLRYIGEWHSHPDGCAALPSDHDWGLYADLMEGMSVEGHPPVMLIVGQNDLGVVTVAVNDSTK
jgi:hypothetical protein